MKTRNTLGYGIVYFFKEYTVSVIIIAIFITMSIITDTFLTANNLANMIRVASIIGIMACGMTFLMIYTGFDLSIGMIMSLIGLLGVTLEPVFGVGAAIFIGLVAGIGLGMANGAILSVIKGGIGECFIITLGMKSVLFGIGQIYSNGYEIRATGNELYTFLGKGDIGGIPFPIILFGIIAAVSHIILNNTGFGRKVFIIGGNRTAAHYAGIRTNWYRVVVFGISGLTAAIAGLVLSSRISVGSARIGDGYEFDVIAAVVIGGTSLWGGEGSIIKTVLGVVLLSMITNALGLLGVPSQFQYIVKGAIIVVAVGLDLLKKSKGGK